MTRFVSRNQFPVRAASSFVVRQDLEGKLKSGIPSCRTCRARDTTPTASKARPAHRTVSTRSKVCSIPSPSRSFFRLIFRAPPAMQPGANDGRAPLGVLPVKEQYSPGLAGPRHAWHEIAIYELHVKGFTRAREFRRDGGKARNVPGADRADLPKKSSRAGPQIGSLGSRHSKSAAACVRAVRARSSRAQWPQAARRSLPFPRGRGRRCL